MDGSGLATEKLHKLTYYCPGYHLAMTGQRLFNETVSAWDMGPVIGILSHQDREGEAPPTATRSPTTEEQLNTIG